VLALLHQGEFHGLLELRERWSPDGGEREAEPRHDVAAVEVVHGAERVWRRGAAQPDILRPRPASTKLPRWANNAASFWNAGARGTRCLAENAGSLPVLIGDCSTCV